MTTTPTNDGSFATRYRPGTLDEIIGQEANVARLKGMLKKGIPRAFLFVGPSSAGKTTMARALAAAINGKPADQQTDLKEVDGTNTRTIEELRELVKLSKFRPSNKKRIFIIDEAQQIVSNAQAAPVLLKPLEDGAPDTVFMLCSMDPSKFTTGNGKAIANRCQQFVLKAPEEDALREYAKRIIKAEKLRYLMSTSVLDGLVNACGAEYRTLANLIQNCRDYYEGSNKKAEKLSVTDLSEVLSSSSTDQSELVEKFVVGALTGQFKACQAALLDVEDGVGFLNQLHYAAAFLVNSMAVSRHKKVWWTPLNKKLNAATKGSKLGDMAAFFDLVVSTKVEAGSFQLQPQDLLTRNVYRFIKAQG
jgi:DNA polymerase III gamma/tau subunit